jgi:hypothetical protein
MPFKVIKGTFHVRNYSPMAIPLGSNRMTPGWCTPWLAAGHGSTLGTTSSFESKRLTHWRRIITLLAAAQHSTSR